MAQGHTILHPDSKVLIFFSNRNGGTMKFDEAVASYDQVFANRENFFSAVGIPLESSVWMNQVHGKQVAIVKKNDAGKGSRNANDDFSQTDALVTKEMDVALMVQVADCAAIVLWDGVAGAMAIVHAGWKGTSKEIAKTTAKKMMQEFGCRASDMRAWFGPSIGKECYEVRQDVAKYFSEKESKTDDVWLLDVKQENKNQLREVGLREENIQDSGICTLCENEKYYSFRKEGKSAGRIAVGIMLQ